MGRRRRGALVPIALVLALGSWGAAASEASNPMGLTGGDVLGSLAQHYASQHGGKGKNGGFLSFLGWARRGQQRKRTTPFFIPPEMMRLPEQDEEEEKRQQEACLSTEDDASGQGSKPVEEGLDTAALTDEESEAEEVAAVLVSRMTRTTTITGSVMRESSGRVEGEEVGGREGTVVSGVFMKEEVEEVVLDAEPPEEEGGVDADDGIPNGRSLLASLSVIGGGLPLRRGGAMAAAGAAAGAAVVMPAQGEEEDMGMDMDADEDVAEVETVTALDVATEEEGRIVTTTARTTTVERHVHTHVHTHTHTHTTWQPSDAELAQRFRAETAKKVAALAPGQRAALEELKSHLYGPDVASERVQALDQLVVCGDRGAMLLAFLARKEFDLGVAKSSLDRVIQWRIDERIETVIEDGRLERAKVEKHRECWPTAFYERTHNGEPIFVDRMGILDLNRLKKSLTMKDMVTYYVQTMEARRRILFPHLSRRTGQLVTQYVSVIDVASFGPMHFGAHALGFMKELGSVHDESLVSRLYIINAPGGWLFRNIIRIIQRMMPQDVKDRLKILSKKEALAEFADITDPATAQGIVDGDFEAERAAERELHAFLDAAAMEGHHRRRWGLEEEAVAA